MILFKKPADWQKWRDHHSPRHSSIGFVPTMGALHQGHLSLIALSKAANDITVCSIFVNPTQFNNRQDFEKYPITIEADIALLHDAGADVLFLPGTEDIYPNGTVLAQPYALGTLETLLDGHHRPGHFQGVCQVVQRLFEIIEPQQAYFGQKDYQQCMVISRLVAIMGWQNRLQLHFGPTLREPDGLAMSSRNRRLNASERAIAPVIYQTLCFIKKNLAAGDLTALAHNAYEKLVSAGLRPDYVSIAHAQTLEPCLQWDGRSPLVALVAAFLNEVRLIDNMPLS
jgi:pantoate--beta-alanine ligase